MKSNCWHHPKGKSVQECFDLKKMEPSPEYKAIYNKVKNELMDLGMPLNKVYGEMVCFLC
ncbi:monomethylamine:corrinoid methyltransferase [endosymbiont 'TC1' of Trimyema compressum]|uniref:monomethylamine:corrinoid methyltransferase n=1 Tax=endosymbiont 'TC1' of Trimyema compressum TaxID=243899 RepID=UPI00139224B7